LRALRQPDLLSFPTRRSSDLLFTNTGCRIAAQRHEAADTESCEFTHDAVDFLACRIHTGQMRRRLDVGFLQDACHSTRRAFTRGDRKSTRLNSSHVKISYAVF